MLKSDKIFIAGHKGLVGEAFLRHLKSQKYRNIITKNKDELDLRNYNDVMKFFKKNKIDILLICAAKVGGILSNLNNPFEFILYNTKIQNNLFEAAKIYKLKKIMFMGSSCIYPKFAKNPIKESQLLSGYLEKTNEAYALSKIQGLKTAEFLIKKFNLDIRCFMPCNLFGYADKFFDKGNNHVIPALIDRVFEAKMKNLDELIIWGDGTPKREFMHADDLALNIINLMKVNRKSFLKNIGEEYFYNIGCNKEISIKSLTYQIVKILKYKGNVRFDKTKPNGTLRKFMSKDKLKKLIKINNQNFNLMLIKTINHYLYLRKKKNELI